MGVPGSEASLTWTQPFTKCRKTALIIIEKNGANSVNQVLAAFSFFFCGVEGRRAQKFNKF